MTVMLNQRVTYQNTQTVNLQERKKKKNEDGHNSRSENTATVQA
jgi:hypothetical protein